MLNGEGSNEREIRAESARMERVWLCQGCASPESWSSQSDNSAEHAEELSL